MMTSIREAEQRLQQDQAWVLKPKPKVTMKPFTDDYHTDLRTLDRERQWFDLVHLALQTDSTRVIALWIWSYGRVNLPGVAIGHHDATHHGQDEAKIRQLAMIEEAEMALFAGLLGKMKDTDENGSSLLDRTVVFYGSNMGNASAHTCENLPILLAGGGFRHAGHVAFDRKDNKPLSNLFVRILHQMDIEADRFGSSTGTLRGLSGCRVAARLVSRNPAIHTENIRIIGVREIRGHHAPIFRQDLYPSHLLDQGPRTAPGR